MKPVKQVDGKFYGQLNGTDYPIQDDFAAVFMERWESLEPAEVVKEVLKDSAFWGEALDQLPGFENSVIEKVNLLINSGAKRSVEIVQSKKEVEV
jgi:tagaturonate reductase